MGIMIHEHAKGKGRDSYKRAQGNYWDDGFVPYVPSYVFVYRHICHIGF
jgi:hypothetical protein